VTLFYREGSSTQQREVLQLSGHTALFPLPPGTVKMHRAPTPLSSRRSKEVACPGAEGVGLSLCPGLHVRVGTHSSHEQPGD
jgi:hypothetical protein